MAFYKVLAFPISVVNYFVHNLKCLIQSSQTYFISFSCFSKLFFLMQIVRTLCLFLTPSERKCSRLCRSESSFKYESGLFVQGLLKVSVLRKVLFFSSLRIFFSVCFCIWYAHTYTHSHSKKSVIFPWYNFFWHCNFSCNYLHVKIPSQSFLLRICFLRIVEDCSCTLRYNNNTLLSAWS